MALVGLDGQWSIPIGAGITNLLAAPTLSGVTLDAVNEAAIMIGHIKTSDGASHTINTTGSSSIGWRSGSVTFSNGSTTVKVGLAAVDTANGPPGRAVNASDVISFDVNASFTGGGGGIAANSWQTSVPTAGTKTIASGDLVALCVQMTARGGADSIGVSAMTITAGVHRPLFTGFLGGSYTLQALAPNAIITFSDGAIGFFQAADVFATLGTRTWNSGSGTVEYGQLFKLPFPTKIYGAYGFIDPDADCDIVLYSDPLGTPVAERTTSLDANTMASATGRKFIVTFASPYTTTANQNIGIVFKPGGSNVSAYFRTLADAAHRVADPWGTDGYGISRAAGAFADANSSLDHYYIGLILGAFDDGAGSGGGGHIASRQLLGM
jgi:hypothetical protein